MKNKEEACKPIRKLKKNHLSARPSIGKIKKKHVRQLKNKKEA